MLYVKHDMVMRKQSKNSNNLLCEEILFPPSLILNFLLFLVSLIHFSNLSSFQFFSQNSYSFFFLLFAQNNIFFCINKSIEFPRFCLPSTKLIILFNKKLSFIEKIETFHSENNFSKTSYHFFSLTLFKIPFFFSTISHLYFQDSSYPSLKIHFFSIFQAKD